MERVGGTAAGPAALAAQAPAQTTPYAQPSNTASSTHAAVGASASGAVDAEDVARLLERWRVLQLGTPAKSTSPATTTTTTTAPALTALTNGLPAPVLPTVRDGATPTFALRPATLKVRPAARRPAGTTLAGAASTAGEGVAPRPLVAFVTPAPSVPAEAAPAVVEKRSRKGATASDRMPPSPPPELSAPKRRRRGRRQLILSDDGGCPAAGASDDDDDDDGGGEEDDDDADDGADDDRRVSSAVAEEAMINDLARRVRDTVRLTSATHASSTDDRFMPYIL